MPLFDDSAMPLLRYEFSPAVSDEEIAAAVGTLAAIFERGERVVVVADISRLSVQFTVERRKNLELLMRTIQRDADRLMIGAIYVAPGMVARGVVTALNWARGKRPYPVRFVATVDEALAIANELLERSK